jgi:hypothetical protein
LLVVEISFDRQNGQRDGDAGAVAELASDTDSSCKSFDEDWRTRVAGRTQESEQAIIPPPPWGDSMDQRLARLLKRQVAAGFEDLRGAEAAVTLPVSDRLLNEIIAEALPSSGRVRDVEVRAQTGNRFAVRARIGGASFLPPLNLTVAIDRQPELPASPSLVLRLERGGLLSLAGPALRFFDALPPGIRIQDDRIHVDLAQLLEARGLSGFLEHLEQLHIDTTEGTTILSVRARIR